MQAIETFMRDIPMKKTKSMEEELTLYKISVKIFIKNVQNQLRSLLSKHKQQIESLSNEIQRLKSKLKNYENSNNYPQKNLVNKTVFQLPVSRKQANNDIKNKSLQLFSSSLSRVKTDKTSLFPTPKQTFKRWNCFNWLQKKNQENLNKYSKTIASNSLTQQVQKGFTSYNSLIIQDSINKNCTFQSLYSKFHSSELLVNSIRKSRFEQQLSNQNLQQFKRQRKQPKCQNQQTSYKVRQVLRSIRNQMGSSCENQEQKKSKSKVKINPFPCTPQHKKLTSNKKSILKNKGKTNQTQHDLYF